MKWEDWEWNIETCYCSGKALIVKCTYKMRYVNLTMPEDSYTKSNLSFYIVF